MEKQILLIVDLFCSYRVANWSFILSFLRPFMAHPKDFHTRLYNALICKGMWAKNCHEMDGKLQHEDKQKGC